MQLIFTYLLIAVGAGIALPVKEWALVSVSEFRILVGTREMVEHQQTKELSKEHNIRCSNEVVLCCYDWFGCITVMYRQHITVKIW